MERVVPGQLLPVVCPLPLHCNQPEFIASNRRGPPIVSQRDYLHNGTYSDIRADQADSLVRAPARYLGNLDKRSGSDDAPPPTELRPGGNATPTYSHVFPPNAFCIVAPSNAPSDLALSRVPPEHLGLNLGHVADTRPTQVILASSSFPSVPTLNHVSSPSSLRLMPARKQTNTRHLFLRKLPCT